MPIITHQLPELSDKDQARFWSFVEKRGANECWPWTGYKDQKGYGCLRVGNRTAKAHRISYLLAHGSIPNGQLVCHSCDNPPCTNPAHLWVGTNNDNSADRDRKGRNVVSFGDANGARLHPESKPRGEDHHSSKLTEEQVREILKLAGKLIPRIIGEKYGISRQSVVRIIERKNWTHISIGTEKLMTGPFESSVMHIRTKARFE